MSGDRTRSRRVVIVYDGTKWHVRRLRVSEHDLLHDEMIYRCDRPIVNDCASLDDAVRALKRGTRRPKCASKRRVVVHLAREGISYGLWLLACDDSKRAEWPLLFTVDRDTATCRRCRAASKPAVLTRRKRTR